jgi:UDP-N-acetylglucosamine acyltransferase
VDNNRVDPGARLFGDVDLGSENVIESGAVIVGPIRIGDGNYFGPHCVVGAPAQDEVLADELRRSGLRATGGSVSIGNRNVIREFVTVHRGLTGETVIGDDCYTMARSHVAHDCVIRDGTKIATNVQISGYCWIGRGTYLGLSSLLHQFVVVGGHSMVGMGSILTRTTPPGSLVYGNPARLVRPNAVALERLGVSRTDWWEELRDGTSTSPAPQELAEDLDEFEAATARAIELRASVTAWRDARRESGGTD